MQSAHNFYIEGLQGVTGRLDEVDTGVDAVVDNVHTVDLVLCIEVCVKALLNVLHNRAPGLGVVHKVSKARGIDNVESQTNPVLFDVGAD